MHEELDRLLEQAKKVVMTPAQQEEQRRSFAYGNTKIENDLITRQMIDEAAERLAQILAIEMAFASQAELVRAENPAEAAKAVKLGRAGQGALSRIREAFPPWVRGGDRELTWDIETLAERVLSGEIAKATGYSFERH